MKISRDYVLGLGSGLVASALILFALQLGGFGINSNGTDAETNPAQTSSEIMENEVQSGVQLDTTGEREVPSVKTTETDSGTSTEVRFTVPYGANAVSIANLLEKQELITDKQTFIHTAAQLNVAKKFQTGTFTLKKGQSLFEIIYILSQKPN
jgi:hypothetical protein